MYRRDFLKNSTLLSLGVLTSNCGGFTQSTIGLKEFGINLFSMPKLLENNFKGGIEMLSQIGYTEIELYGPFPFSSDIAKSSWNAVTPKLGFGGSGYFGHSILEFKSILDKFNIKVTSTHLDLETLKTRMEQVGQFANVLGIKYVGIPSIPAEKRKSLDDYKRMAEEFNKIGEEAKKVGLKFAYHNHGYGLKEMDGQIPLHIILNETDPDLVFFEMDIFWTTAGEANPVDYLKAYPQRYKLMHIKDMKEKVSFSGDGGSKDQWIELFPYMTTAGNGVLDLKAIIGEAKKAGVEHFYVEQDMVENPEVALKRSIEYLKTI